MPRIYHHQNSLRIFLRDRTTTRLKNFVLRPHSFGAQFKGVIQNNNGTTTMVGDPSRDMLGTTGGVSGAVGVAADDPNDALVIGFSGDFEPGTHTTRWVAVARTVEVKF